MLPNCCNSANGQVIKLYTCPHNCLTICLKHLLPCNWLSDTYKCMGGRGQHHHHHPQLLQSMSKYFIWLEPLQLPEHNNTSSSAYNTSHSDTSTPCVTDLLPHTHTHTSSELWSFNMPMCRKGGWGGEWEAGGCKNKELVLKRELLSSHQTIERRESRSTSTTSASSAGTSI